MLKKLTLLVGLTLSASAFAQINSGNPSVPFGSNTGYDYGMFPSNLPTSGAYGPSTAAGQAYNDFKQGFIENCGANEARVRFDNRAETVSEGIAYTMLLAAYAADQDVFNRLWAYYKNRRNQNGVMHWKYRGCNVNDRLGQNGATDAELDAAMALIVADKQWGSSGQVHNYTSDAINLINAIKEHEVNFDTFNNGDGWGDANGCRNPSYQSPAYAVVFAQFLADNGRSNTGWDRIATATRLLLKNNSDRTPSGLATNWSLRDGNPNNSCSASGTDPFRFGYDASRAPWRQGTDYLWHGPAATGMQGIINTQVDFWIGRGGASQVQGSNNFNQNGTGRGDHNGAFLGPFGAQSLAASSSPARQNYVNQIYNENRNIGQSGYFNDVMRCIGLFVQTGNFWNPYSTALSGSAPTVSLTAPANNFETCLGVNFTLKANAQDNGSITKVEFYEGNTIINTDNSAPWSFTVTNATAGIKNYRARAFDNQGNSTFSTARTVTISTIQSTDGVSCGGTATEGFNAFVDDFDSVDPVSLGATGTYGIYWFVGKDAPSTNTFSITRTATRMDLGVTNASSGYPVFGLGFGEGNTIDLSAFANANINIDITNKTNGLMKLAIQLKDSDGGSAEFVPELRENINNSNRWKKIGSELASNQRFNGTIDLSGIPNILGGLAPDATGGEPYRDCGVSAALCPATRYSFNPSKLSQVIFLVNGGAGTDEPNLAKITGTIEFRYLAIGELTNPSSKILQKGAALPPNDSDGDMVDDAIDACPLTPNGESVDNNGCAESQLDGDKDGVFNDVDRCLGTPAGEPVDANGCGLTGVSSISAFQIEVFPNPAQNILNINQKSLVMHTASLLNITGNEVLSKTLNSSNETIELSGVSEGVYILHLYGEQGSAQQKVVVR